MAGYTPTVKPPCSGDYTPRTLVINVFWTARASPTPTAPGSIACSIFGLTTPMHSNHDYSYMIERFRTPADAEHFIRQEHEVKSEATSHTKCAVCGAVVPGRKLVAENSHAWFVCTDGHVTQVR